MKKINLITFLLLAFIWSCDSTDRKLEGESSENATDAARNFIRAALDGNYDKARTYLVDDSLNQQDLNASERLYKERMTKEEKEKYRGASIRFHQVRDIDSTTSIVYFSNTYRNQQDSLRVQKINDKWLVDFKYIFKHKPDSLQ